MNCLLMIHFISSLICLKNKDTNLSSASHAWHRLTLCYWVIFHAFLSSADFFQNQLFRKKNSEIPLEV